MMKLLKSDEWWRIWICRTFKIEIQEEGPNNSDILQNWLPPKIRSPVFNLEKFQDCEDSTPESCRMRWNVMHDEEFGSIELLRLKYRHREEIVKTFWKSSCPKRLGPPSLICRNWFLEISRLWQRYSLIMQNTFKCNEWRRICV